MITWVLEKNVFAEKCFDQMVNHFKENNIPYHIVKVIPFIHEIDGEVPNVINPCVVYGSIGTQKLAQKHSWSPGVWTNDQFNEDVLIKKLGTSMLNDEGYTMKMSEVSIFIKETNDVFSMTDFFIKPNTDTKEFAGQLISVDNFDKWYQDMIDIGYLDDNDFDVVISLPKKLGMEWRLVIINGKVCECSIYKQYQIVKSEREMNPEVIAFAEKCVKIHNPADVFVMDIAQTEEGLKVIEYNTFNSAGLYACDVSNIIDTINKHLDK